MALTATIYRFEINLSDVDRSVYESLEFRVAQHPSETPEYLVTRIMAMALEYREGLSFGRGLCAADEPALVHESPTGEILLWLDVGHPSPDRLHKASKQAEKVCIYTHKNPDPILTSLQSGTIHRGDQIDLVALDPTFIADLANALQRTNRWEILRSESVVYVTAGEETFQTTPDRR